MAGGAAIRPRRSGTDPREDGSRPVRRGGAALTRRAGRPPAPAHARLRTSTIAAILALGAAGALAGCASAGGPVPGGQGAALPGDTAGVRLLFEARVEGGGARRASFRLAAAVAEPDRIRLEVLGPAGGTRLILATDGAQAVALVVPDRRYDTAAATAGALERWTGVPLAPAGLIDLLRGRSPCAADDCPGLEFLPAAGTPACAGTLVEKAGGRARAVVACDLSGTGGWPEWIRIDLPAGGRSIELRRTEGPAEAFLPAGLFAPAIPAGFRHADLLAGDGGPGPLLAGEPEGAP